MPAAQAIGCGPFRVLLLLSLRMDTDMSNDVSTSNAHVLVICALDVEFDALQAALAEGGALQGGGDDYRELKHFFSRNGILDVLVVQLPTPGAGNVTSSALTANLLPLVNPAFVVSFGIAGTLKETEVPPNSVVYSEVVYYIDLRKDAPDGGEDVKQVPSAGTHPELLKKLDALKRPGEKKAILVSSEAVVKSQESKRRKIAKHAVADASVVEMEAFGVLKACEVEKSLYGTKRFCVAVKGISDKADLTKTDELHLPAANAAASFLVRIFSSPAMTELATRSTEHTNAPPFRRFRVVDLVDDRVESFSLLAAPALEGDLDNSMLVATHLRVPKPRVFYHWRLTGIGLHFVDLRYVSVLRALAESGYPVECLLTDTPNYLAFNKLRSAADYVNAKQAVEHILHGLFAGFPYTLTLYSTIRGQERVLSAFAEPSGGQQALHEALIAAGSRRIPDFSRPEITTEFNLWFRHIAWRCRLDGAGIVLINPRHRSTYDQLWRFGDFVIAPLPTRSLRMGGVMAKTAPPGTDLYLLPPAHDAIVAWVRETSDMGLLEEFHRHLAIRPVDEDLLTNCRNWASQRTEAIPGDPAWLDTFVAGRVGDIDYYRGAIAVELARWTTLMAGERSQQRAD